MLYDACIFKVVTPACDSSCDSNVLYDACIFKVVTPACTLVSGRALTIRPISWPENVFY